MCIIPREISSRNVRKHRTQDFEYLFEGIISIVEQQIATFKNLLPGARKSLPYITETSEHGPINATNRANIWPQSHFILEADRTQQGMPILFLSSTLY